MNEPALTRCPSANTGFSDESPAKVVSARGPSSWLRVIGLSETAPVALSATFITVVKRRDLGLEAAGGLRGGGSLLGLQRIFVLPRPRDLIPLGHDLGCLEHRHVKVVTMLDEPWILSAIAVHLVVLDQRNGFKPAADGDAHAVVDDLLRRGRDRHQAGSALPVERHAGDAGRKAGAQQRLARDVAALRALLHRRSPSRRRRSRRDRRTSAEARSRSHGRRASGPVCR